MRAAALIIAVAILATACGDASAPRAIVATVDERPNEVVPAFVVPDDTRPGLSWVSTTIDGIDVTYALGVPSDVGPNPPILLAFPPGSQDRRWVEVGLDAYWLEEALARGWVVVSPEAPDGRVFFQGSEAVLPGLLDQVAAQFAPEGSVFHVGGISNGGISSFRAVAEFPDRFGSITVLPGFPLNFADLQALDPLTIPITMWAGENDTSWAQSMLEVQSRLEPLGKPVRATVVAGAGHILPATEVFIAEIWETLEAARIG